MLPQAVGLDHHAGVLALLVGWGLLTSLSWLIAVMLGLLGRSGDFPFAGWMVGIGIYLMTYREARRQDGDEEPAGSHGED